MEKFSALLMIAAIVCVLFADKIDTTVKGDRKVKKLHYKQSGVVFLLIGIFGC